MKLRDLLLTIDNLAKQNNISQPFLVGGTPRDKLLNRLDTLNDLDLTTGDSSIHQLAEIVLQHFRSLNPKIQRMSDNHSKIFLGGLQLDFSSNFITSGITPIVQTKGISNPTSLDLEIFSRDFTCNSLLLSMDLKELKDITQQGLYSIKNKILITCLAPDITLKSDPNRIVRAVYLGAKLNFNLHSDISTWIKGNLNYTHEINAGYATRKLNKAFKYNWKKTIELLNDTNLWEGFATLPALEPWRQYRNV